MAPRARFLLAPVLDRRGRFAPLKAATLALLFVPALLTAIDYAADNLGPRPFNQAIHEIGKWTLRLIFITLTVTPLQQLLKWPKLIDVRRMIGVGAFIYVLLHLSLYVIDQAYNLITVATEIALRVYLTIGMVAILGLAGLAATSTDAMVRRMGRRDWSRLHLEIYAIALLGVIHQFMQTKADVYEPTIMAGLYGWLMGYRALQILAGRALTRAPVAVTAALGVAAALVTAGGEALYFYFKGIALLRVLSANLAVDFSFDFAPRPAWVVLAIALAVAALTAATALWRRFTSGGLPLSARSGEREGPASAGG